MKTYDPAPQEVHDRVANLVKRYHLELQEVSIRVDLLMASTDSEEGAAVTHGGYPALAVVKILGPKERAMGRGDAEIVIERDALLDHELYHLEVKLDRNGRYKLDDHMRPCLKMRKHDFNVGWFHEIARRHGTASVEVQQAVALQEEHEQLYFSFTHEERMQALHGQAKSETPKDASGSPAKRFVIETQRMSAKDGTSVTLTTGGRGVKIDKSGVHPIGKEDAA